ncbi:MAG: hypothetical protein CMN62_07475, partial [Sphingobium sp.]|nr:hypothetical protein [Sphingobium sp.]
AAAAARSAAADTFERFAWLAPTSAPLDWGQSWDFADAIAIVAGKATGRNAAARSGDCQR